MRLFIAVNFDNEIKSRILRIRDRIASQSYKGNFSRPENLHLTLIFIGEAQAEQVPLIRGAMEKACPDCGPLSLDFGSTGFFKHSNKELWYIGLANSVTHPEQNSASLEKLEKLRQDIAAGLRAAGINFDDRPFRPHITLGREIRRNGPIELPEQTFCAPVNRISLMHSQNIKGQLVYTEIFAADLIKNQ